MSSSTRNNKRILKNTLMLFFRMILITGVTLYTTRIVLKALGVEDFGIYNVVGGVVLMFGFLNSSMSSAVQRYISIALGERNFERINKVFTMSINIHLLIALVIFLVAETFGVWFLKNWLIIPDSRLSAAIWVYHFSVFTFILSIISVPYNAAIISYEKMNIFAYISILESILKLVAVLILDFIETDKLILYAALIFLISLIVRITYGLYVKYNLKSCKYTFCWDKKLFLSMTSFASWNLWGNLASVLYNQGLNVLLNLFFGPVVNASRAISLQVNAALNSFVLNFQTAMKPQIIKSYANNETIYMERLIFGGAKFSYFLMLLLSLPFFLFTSEILALWLGTVPPYSVIFCRLVLINTLVNSLSGTLMTGAQATGRIKVYQSVVGGILLLILPVSYFFLKVEYPPQSVFVVAIVINSLAFLIRILIVSSLLNFSLRNFLSEVVVPVLLISGIVYLLFLILTGIVVNTIFEMVFISLLLFFITLISIFLFGLKIQERLFVQKKIVKFYQHLNNENK